MDEPREADISPPESPWLRELVSENGLAVALAAGATVAVELGVFAAARWAGVPPARTAVATLATATLWVVLVTAPLAAGARGALGAVFRGGIVADASLPALIVLAVGGSVGAGGAIAVYVVLAAVALAAVAAVRIARTAWGRHALAAATSVVLAVLLASPLWVGGLLGVAEGSLRGRIAYAAIAVNPFYAVTSATAGSTGFVWHQAPVMYSLTHLGDTAAAPPVPWYVTAVLYGCVAGMLAGASLVRKARKGES
jgi:hypothetical protein